nr:aminotransferase class IV family protein [Hoeflea prorocentri]
MIETMRLRANRTIDRLDRHLNRLKRSAQALSIPYDAQWLGHLLDAVDPEGEDRRIRIELTPSGKSIVITSEFPADPDRTIWRLGIASTRLDSTNTLLRHKTTFRDHYTTAREEFPATQADEVLLLNERGEVCEGTITSLFIQTDDTGPLLTPSIECGLLAGVLRQDLLDTGRARQAILTLDDLRGARALYIGNSLRGLMPAVLND